MAEGESIGRLFNDSFGDWKELEKQGQEFAERADDAASRAAGARKEAAKWPESSEWRECYEKEARRWDSFAERNLVQAAYLFERSGHIRSLKIRFQTGPLSVLPENRKEEDVWVSMLSRYVRSYPSGVEIYCQQCRKYGRFDASLDQSLPSVGLQVKAAVHFFKAGWRLECKAKCKILCPDCFAEACMDK